MTESEHLSQPAPEKYRDLRKAVAGKFGDNAVFNYPSPKGGIKPVTFDQALEESGEHFGHLPAEIIIAMLEPMYQKPAAGSESQQRTLGSQALSENTGE